MTTPAVRAKPSLERSIEAYRQHLVQLGRDGTFIANRIGQLRRFAEAMGGPLCEVNAEMEAQYLASRGWHPSTLRSNQAALKDFRRFVAGMPIEDGPRRAGDGRVGKRKRARPSVTAQNLRDIGSYRQHMAAGGKSPRTITSRGFQLRAIALEIGVPLRSATTADLTKFFAERAHWSQASR